MDDPTLYRQIYHTLKADIVSGHYPPGAQLPTETELMHRFGVSRVTVRHALALLQREGLVVRIPAKGTFVRHSDQPSASPKLIALLALDVQLDFFGKLIRGAEQEAAAHGYKLLVRSTDNDAEKERQCLLELQSHVAGFIIAPATGNQNHVHYGQLLVRGVPFVFIDRYLPEFNVDRVTSDNVQGGYLATRYLLELGHRRIGVISARKATTCTERLRGYQQALEEFGVPFDPELIAHAIGKRRDGWDEYLYQGRVQTEALLKLPNPPTALFAMNDLLAVGALRYLRERGIAVPEEMALIGYDGIELSELVSPSLTTVKQQSLRMGAEAVRLLVRRIRNPEQPAQHVVLPVDLHIRASTVALTAIVQTAITASPLKGGG
ncbi:MAG: GntR family transcriptional regulator [Chthonomonadetes bacterium]|nr:GntR family transcriptional regulator [Chthonomonadetes bacterium]